MAAMSPGGPANGSRSRTTRSARLADGDAAGEGVEMVHVGAAGGVGGEGGAEVETLTGQELPGCPRGSAG
ncbi:hypothetical protein IQ64_23475 [Streptomyces stelliscabiei]|nr:hypothetical protein IQ64_23475 [Streptomyces stelliscabiei]